MFIRRVNAKISLRPIFFLMTIYTLKTKKLSLRHKLKFSNLFIFATWWYKSLICQAWTLSKQMYNFKISKVYDIGLQRYRN